MFCDIRIYDQFGTKLATFKSVSLTEAGDQAWDSYDMPLTLKDDTGRIYDMDYDGQIHYRGYENAAA